ncbi:hypothetical protein AX17_002419 [Amanita inopinata Kibby_2008]|nr:hypothetical protein AX17_002419 [Amanita inopinata Kibby_2008]
MPDEEHSDSGHGGPDEIGEDSYFGWDLDAWERQGPRDKDITLPAMQEVKLDSMIPLIPYSIAISGLSSVAPLTLHGSTTMDIRATGNFYELESRLSDPTLNPSNAKLRDHIFSRLREPGNVDHANTRYMPRLFGDDGEIEPGSLSIAAITTRDPIYRFASLTPLQYRHFRQQPELLTYAMLEQGVGDAFYPGIELYWIAKDYDMDLDPPFRFDFTKIRAVYSSNLETIRFRRIGLVTSAIPRMASPLLAFNRTKIHFLRLVDLSSFPGSTDMIKYWSGLDFVVPEAGNRWTERERTLPEFRANSA